MTATSSRHRVLAIVGGLVVLVALAGFAIGLPRLGGGGTDESASAVELPDTLPGGWTALELAPSAAGAQEADPAQDAAYAEQQAQAVAYVNQVLGSVYDTEGTSFQAYVDDSLQDLVTVTVFEAAGGAFSPPNGVADPALFGLERAPVELTRQGGAVCIANYQSAAQAGQAPAGDPAEPLSVSCQSSEGEETVQVGSQGMSVEATVAVLEDVDAALA